MKLLEASIPKRRQLPFLVFEVLISNFYRLHLDR
jgi:hypothetical protein